MLFTDKTGKEIVRREVYRTKQDYYFIRQIIRKGKWLDNERYVVSDKKGIVNFIAQLNDDAVELDIQANENISREQVLERLELLKP